MTMVIMVHGGLMVRVLSRNLLWPRIDEIPFYPEMAMELGNLTVLSCGVVSFLAGSLVFQFCWGMVCFRIIIYSNLKSKA